MFNLPANIKYLVTELRKLSETKKKIILFSVVGIFTVLLGYFWVTDTMSTISQIGGAVKSQSLPNINAIESQLNSTNSNNANNMLDTTSPETNN